MNQYIGEISSTASALTWATTIILFRQAGFHYRPQILVMVTTLIATLLYGFNVAFMDIPLFPEISDTQWFRLILSSLLGIVLGDILVMSALNRLGAGLDAVVACFYAPSVMVLAFFMFGETIPFLGLIGAALVAIAILVGSGGGIEFRPERAQLVIGILLGITAQFVVGLGALIARDVYTDHSVFWVNFIRFGFASLILIGLNLKREGIQIVKEAFHYHPSMKYLIPGAILGPYVSTYLWLTGFKYTLAGRAAILNQLSTVFVFILAAIFLKESMTPRRVTAVILAFAGAIIVNLS